MIRKTKKSSPLDEQTQNEEASTMMGSSQESESNGTPILDRDNFDNKPESIDQNSQTEQIRSNLNQLLDSSNEASKHKICIPVPLRNKHLQNQPRPIAHYENSMSNLARMNSFNHMLFNRSQVPQYGYLPTVNPNYQMEYLYAQELFKRGEQAKNMGIWRQSINHMLPTRASFM